MNKFKVGDDIVLIDITGLTENKELKGSSFTYDMDFADGVKWGHISNNTVAMAAPWSSLQLKSEYDMQNNQSKTEVKRIPFDLERAKKGDKVINRKSEFVDILKFDRREYVANLNIVALHDCAYSGNEFLVAHKYDGTSLMGQEYDLFMAPVEKKGWIGIMKTKEDHITAIVTHAYPDETSLLKAINEYFTECILICTKEISWTE